MDLPNLSDKSVAFIPGKTDITRYQTLEGVDFPVRNIVFADLFRHLGTDVPVHDDGTLGGDEDVPDKTQGVLVLNESHSLTVIVTQVLEELMIFIIWENHLCCLLIILWVNREGVLGDDVGHTHLITFIHNSPIEIKETDKVIMVSSPDVGVNSELDTQFLAESIDLGQSLIGDEVLIVEGQVQSIETIGNHIFQELVSQGDTIGGQPDNLDTSILQSMDDITDVRMESGFAAEDNRFLDIVSVDQFNHILCHLPDWNGEGMVSVTIDAVRTVPVALVGGDHRQVGIVGHQADVLGNIDVGLEDFQRVFLNCSHNLTDLLY